VSSNALNSTINVYKMKYEILTVSESNTYMPFGCIVFDIGISRDICAGIMKRRTADDTWAEMIVDAIEWSKGDIPNGQYDPATGTVTFSTTHFSYYAVGFAQVSFNDVAAKACIAKQ